MSRMLLRRLRQLEQAFGVGEDQAVGLEQLESLLCCSRRNVSNILASLQEQGWIRWTGAVGRGRQSELRVLLGGMRPSMSGWPGCCLPGICSRPPGWRPRRHSRSGSAGRSATSSNASSKRCARWADCLSATSPSRAP
ncbi:hypothetical protein E2P79_15550 [Aeromonas schubertii]|nr:hypothetical protein E2P79_15550 [Aeromonas schubertii]